MSPLIIVPQPKPNELDAELAFYALTDLGNAERFAKRLKSRLIWCEDGWRWWDGICWRQDGAEQHVTRAVHYVVRCIQMEAKWLRASGKDTVADVRYKGTKAEQIVMQSDILSSWGRQSEDARRLNSIGKHAAPMMLIRPEQLDADPHKINVRNGTLVVHPERSDSDPIEFRPHDPADYMTRVMDVRFDRTAQCPVYDQTLAKVQPNIQVRRLLHQWAGYGLTGLMSEQRFVFFWGKGRNGKTTLLEAWSAVMGSYARSIPVETFIDSGRARGAGQATPDLAMLRGIRFVHTDEPDKGTKLSEGLIKRITGGDPLEVRDLHRTYFTMRPVCKITITGNYRPKIQGGESSQGIWRRLILIHWPVTLQITELDKRLPEKLRAEASGILNRMLDGLRDFLDYGLLIPDDVQATTEEFREESDTLGRFLEECTVCDVNASTDTATFHATYVAWAKHHGERVWSAKTFGMAMRERGLRQQRDKVRRWIDIRLIKSTGDFKADEPLQQSDNQAGSPIEDDDVPL